MYEAGTLLMHCLSVMSTCSRFQVGVGALLRGISGHRIACLGVYLGIIGFNEVNTRSIVSLM